MKRNEIISFPVDNESDIGTCRRKAVSLAADIGFNEVKQGEIAIIISELGTNVIKHGGGKGKIVVCQFEDDENRKAIEIWCCDSGNGFQDVNKSMKDGISKSNTLGIGLGTVNRFSDRMEINPIHYSNFQNDYFSGTNNFHNCLRSIKWLPEKKKITFNKSLITGAASRPFPGETLNGDSYVLSNMSGSETIISVIDGLGHGKYANIASEKAKEQILLNDNLSVDNLMNRLHSSLRGTRGATIGITKINTQNNKLYFSGIGNIETFIITNEGSKSIISFGGIVGHNMRTPRVYEFSFLPGDVLCMYSDGIQSRWRHEEINWKDNPQEIADRILLNYSRPNDDATILIVRYVD
jgi:anti-sigma regulatory factor (Ser/Thr protein kinase)